MVERTSYTPGTPSWIDLAATDPQRAMAFYTELFGWELDRGGPETEGYTLCRVRGRAVAGINGQPAPDGMPTTWITYLAVDDVGATAERIQEAGGSVLMGPMQVMDAGAMLLGSDPTGAIFGAWQAGTHAGAELVNEPGALVWNELATRDLAAAEDFYTKVFGYDYEAVPEAEGLTYHMFSTQGDGAAGAVGGMYQLPVDVPAEVPAHWALYFAVADADAAVATAERLGGTVEQPPSDTPFGRMAALADPTGGHFFVICPPQDA